MDHSFQIGDETMRIMHEKHIFAVPTFTIQAYFAAHPLTPVLEQVIAEIKSAWPDVTIDAAIDVVEPVNCDRGKMGQLFSNLLGNAVTYGDPTQPNYMSRLHYNTMYLPKIVERIEKTAPAGADLKSWRY